MSFKPGQWVVVDTEAPYWPNFLKDKKGPFRISHIHMGGQGKYAVLEKAPNNAYFQHLTLYKPQIGDKVKILKPMAGYYPEGHLPNTVGQTHVIIEKYIDYLGQAKIRIGEWWYLDEEGVYELVEPKGSINTATPETPSTPVVKPTKRVLNGNV